jgi:uncharacterized damage-inducible protein DinB
MKRFIVAALVLAVSQSAGAMAAEPQAGEYVRHLRYLHPRGRKRSFATSPVLSTTARELSSEREGTNCEAQLAGWNLQGWDVLLAMFVHVAHHRGQAEIYVRDNGIVPPPYRV